MLTTVRTRTSRTVATAVLAATAALGSTVVTAAPAEATTLGTRAVQEAAKHYRQPYKYGAAGPDRFDCSGFTMYVFSRLGKSLPHSSRAQYTAPGVHHVSRASLQPGDLVFTFRDGTIKHVGIYAGGNEMWAATQTGDVVRKQSMANRVLRYGRVG